MHKNTKECEQSFFNDLVNYAYTFSNTTNSHVTRFKMYNELKDIFASFDHKDKKVLCISGSKNLCHIAGIHQAQITEIAFPDFTVEKLAFLSDQFDFVFSDQVIEHVQFIQDACQELMRVLKPGGHFIHTTCFMNEIHAAPYDFWRPTPDGLRELFAPFCDEIKVRAWGTQAAIYLLDKHRFRPVPDDPANPIYKLAMSDEQDYPITLWCWGSRRQVEIPYVHPKEHYVLESRTKYQVHNEPCKLAVLACVKNEAPYLLEWIAYHRVVGVEHFYLYDNESDDGTYHILNKLSQAGIVSATFWKSPKDQGKQVPAYNHWLKNNSKSVERIAVIDGDEFIVPLEHENLNDVLEDYSIFSGLTIQWSLFGSSGCKFRNCSKVTETFQKKWCNFANFGKNIYTVSTLKAIDVHYATYSSGSCVFLNKEPAIGQIYPTDKQISGNIQLNHYFCKSFEEFMMKRARGRGTQSQGSPEEIRPINFFDIHDKNDTEDTAILRFKSKTDAEIAFLRTLL